VKYIDISKIPFAATVEDQDREQSYIYQENAPTVMAPARKLFGHYRENALSTTMIW
jgi:hypothetical protein